MNASHHVRDAGTGDAGGVGGGGADDAVGIWVVKPRGKGTTGGFERGGNDERGCAGTAGGADERCVDSGAGGGGAGVRCP